MVAQFAEMSQNVTFYENSVSAAARQRRDTIETSETSNSRLSCKNGVSGGYAKYSKREIFKQIVTNMRFWNNKNFGTFKKFFFISIMGYLKIINLEKSNFRNFPEIFFFFNFPGYARIHNFTTLTPENKLLLY